MRLADCVGVAGCHHGRLLRTLTPPPPPAVSVNGNEKAVSFQTPVEAIVLLALSVRFVPPTASTHGEVAGQEADCCSSALVSWLAGTPCAHDDEPASPAATTVVMPSDAVAAS